MELTQATLRARVSQIEAANDLRQITSQQAWEMQQETLRDQLREMLGIPERDLRDNQQLSNDLSSTTTDTLETDAIIVEKVYFQSHPGLYVTGNLYRPKITKGRLPAVLYVCGHGQVKENGVSLGNKTHYQHHPAFLAENGYIALAIDTIQLGEIEGIHHGLYRYNRWDWPSRGYTPAGVEAWNASRAVDYLISRDDVDATKIGITGRSGGGAYSWYAAAIDPRIIVVIPVAGITDLRDHVIDQCVRGHCDCMYFVNRYGWDYSTLAALIHPRPLLIGNTDEDPIFPLDGVFRVQQQVRHLYQFHAKDQLGIQWTTGGHQDTQELQVGCFVWFDRHLMLKRRRIEQAATARFEKSELKVFKSLPADQRVTDVQDWFVPLANSSIPNSQIDWENQRESIRDEIIQSVKGRLPTLTTDSINTDACNATSNTHEWTMQSEQISNEWKGTLFEAPVHPSSKVSILKIIHTSLESSSSSTVTVDIANTITWTAWTILKTEPTNWSSITNNLDKALVHYFVYPEGTGPWIWNAPENIALHFRRSYGLVGWSLEGRQVAGIAQAVACIRSQHPDANLELHADAPFAPHALHAALMEYRSINRLVLEELDRNAYFDGFVILGVLRRFDLPQTLAATASLVPTTIKSPKDPDESSWIQKDPFLLEIQKLHQKPLLVP
jgi:dienelactone hydrolase